MLDWLFDFISSFFSSCWHILKLGLDGIITLLTTVLYWFWDGFLWLVTNLISTLDLSALAFNHYAAWADLPPQLLYLINQLALPQCAAMIASAIFIRMVLNLIPAALTRI
jgi:hypothetical protein